MLTTAKNWIDKIVWGDSLRAYKFPGRLLAGSLRNLYAVMRDIASGQLTMRAMSLVYTTLLSVVPLIAFSFSVVKGLGIHKEFETQLRAFLEPIGPEVGNELMALVERVNGSVLGGVGLAFLVYTAISMVQKVEESFNYVWYVSKARSIATRFTEYMLILLIVPVAIVITFGAIASIGNEAVVLWLSKHSIFGMMFSATSKLTPYILVTSMFTFLYWYMPNTKVRFKAALVGGLTGGILWASAGIVFAAFLANSPRTLQIYAGFAIAVTSLFWLYLNWLILMVGSQVAFYFQNPAYLRIGRREPRLSNAMRERIALNIMYYVGQEFRHPKEKMTLRRLSSLMRIPSITLAPIAASLENNGLLSVNEDDALSPGREMARIELRDILKVVRQDGETGSNREPRWSSPIAALGDTLDAVIDVTLAQKTLADLLDEIDASKATEPTVLENP